MLKTAIVLAGGFGTRLQSVVKDLPKPMAPVAGYPFLKYVLDFCSKQGLENIILSVGYKHEDINIYFKQSFQNLKLNYCIEQNALGTGGAIRESLKKTNDENVVVLNGDTLFTINLQHFANLHRSSNSDLSIALKPMVNFDRYGIVSTNSSNQITGFEEKSFRWNGNINGGVYILNQSVSKYFPESENFSFEKNFMEQKFDLLKMSGFVFDDYFIDIGVPEDYERAQYELAGF